MPRTDSPGAADDVEALVAALDSPRREMVQTLRAIIRGADARIRESVKWNAPSFATSEHFATFHLRTKTGVQVVLHLGAKARPESGVRTGVQDPAGLLEWRGPDRAIVTFADGADVAEREAAFVAVLRQWIGFIR
ncbi:MAG TPA: DUF1801 domain-containing protein [Gemmatimonadaceae bacterium]|nr:DUF1801 domain-containing protein [Gemmatimonadaceae bacterium]